MNKHRKHYEAAFKLEIARMVVDLGLSITQVVKEMSNWVNPVSGSLSLPSSNAYANWRPRTELRSDNVIKKSIGLLCPRTEMIYNLIKQGQQMAISQACRVLQVSRSGYYTAKRRIEKPAICVASVQVKAAFVANQRCYGSRRIVDELKSQHIVMGRYKVLRLMREAGLKPVWKKRFVNTTDSTIYLWQRTCPIPCDHIPVRSWPLFRACQLMRDNIESLQGEMITRRFATVDGNLRGNKRLHRFTLCGKAKVDGQWKLFCLV